MCLPRVIVRLALVFTLAAASTAFAQPDLWSHVSPQAGPQRLESATLSDAQKRSVAHLLRLRQPFGAWDCQASEVHDLIQGLTFETIPNSSKQNLVLVQAGVGCARGAQGSNGAMWLFRFDGPAGTTPVLVTPKKFSGWLFSVQPALSHGYPDIILGWHMSAFESPLTYFRFDGKSYHPIGSASLQSDGGENVKIVPAPR